MESALQTTLQFGALGVLAIFFCYVLPLLIGKIIKALEKRDEVYSGAIERLAKVIEESNRNVARLILSLARNPRSR
jgi:hypothetical protein